MDTQKITRTPLRGNQIEAALTRIAERNPKADIDYLQTIPAYSVELDGKVTAYIWLLHEKTAFRVCGAVSLDDGEALTLSTLDHLKQCAKAAGKTEVYFLTTRPGMVNLAEGAGFYVSEIIMSAEV